MAKVDRLLGSGNDVKGKSAKSAEKPARKAPRKKSAPATSRKKAKSV
jgi:hypothetical protein